MIDSEHRIDEWAVRGILELLRSELCGPEPPFLIEYAQWYLTNSASSELRKHGQIAWVQWSMHYAATGDTRLTSMQDSEKLSNDTIDVALWQDTYLWTPQVSGQYELGGGTSEPSINIYRTGNVNKMILELKLGIRYNQINLLK